MSLHGDYYSTTDVRVYFLYGATDWSSASPLAVDSLNLDPDGADSITVVVPAGTDPGTYYVILVNDDWYNAPSINHSVCWP